MAKKRDDVFDGIYSQFNRKNAVYTSKTRVQNMYIRILSELACNRFRWIGLPDTIDHRFLEMTLYYNAFAVFYFDEEFGRFMALRGAGTGPVNMYDNPTHFRVIGNTMVNKDLKPSECVPIWANTLRIPDHDITMTYAPRLAEIETTIDVNILTMRNPVILAVDQNTKLSVQNAYRQLQEGQPVIITTPSFAERINDAIAPLTMVPTNFGDQVLKIAELKNSVWNDCMTLFGVNNADTDKKERMLVPEIASNESQVNAYRNIGLSLRQQAADQINRMFLDSEDIVKVEWNEDVVNALSSVPQFDLDSEE